MEEKEKQIETIARSIKEHRKLETKLLQRPDKNLAVALSNVHYMGTDRKMWITNRENVGGFYRTEDFTGGISAPIEGGPTTLTQDGDVIYKNTKIGEILIRNASGKQSFPTPMGEKEIEIFNLTTYQPDKHFAEAYDLVFSLQGHKPNQYKTLSKVLEAIDGINQEILGLEESQEEIGQTDNDELRRITEELEDAKRKKEQLLNAAQSFIRKNAELRHQPILDPWQEEVKRSHLFDATVAIDGGPGTGKTTSLIQRIKFLTDKHAMLGSEAQGDFTSAGYLREFSKSQIDALFRGERNWVFFTPNELLKLFLRNSMINEGLQADDQRVLIWQNYVVLLLKQYKLVNPETQNPFLLLRKGFEDGLLPHSGKELRNILTAFKNHILELHKAKLTKLSSLDVSRFRWKDKATSIQNYIKKQDGNFKFEDLVRLYLNLQENYEQEVQALTSEFNESLKLSAARLVRILKSNSDFREKAFAFAEDWKRNTQNIEETDDELEEDDLEENPADQEAFLFGKFKILIKNIALSRFDSNATISKKYRDFLGLIRPFAAIEQFDEFNELGQLAFFSKYFVQPTRGLVRNMVVEIPKAYKEFRKKELSEKSNPWNYDLLRHLVEEDNTKKRIHPEEQSLLIYYINTFIKLCYKIAPQKSASINHPYFQAFRQSSVPVIGVDEATDFHLIDLLAIHSLGDLDISSVTFSGDIMQRLTHKGIRTWDDLAVFVKNFEVKPLMVSYRQSPTLLEVASAIYKKATNKEAEYLSFSDRDPKEPKPLWFKSNADEDKINWIADRILEIYYAYGNSIPAVAIFMASSDTELTRFAEELAEVDKLADNGIQVRVSTDGNVLGDSNMVRVFPIDYIKGLEFEAVFFHNLQALSEKNQSPEMVMKNLYVGLSRASFFMGVTSGMDTEGFDFIEGLFEKQNLSWNLKNNEN